jgi:hypothetical protein
MLLFFIDLSALCGAPQACRFTILPVYGGRPQLSRNATVAVVSAMVLIPVIALVIISNAGRSAGVDAFNACIGQKHFLVATKRRSGHRVIDTIKDRARGTVVGVFAVLSSVQERESFTSTIGPPGGTGEANGRMILFTRIPDGRDTRVILACGTPEFPGP